MTALTSIPSTQVNFEEIGRSVLAKTNHIKHSHDIIPDDVEKEQYAKYPAKTLIEFFKYEFRLINTRNETERVAMTILNSTDNHVVFTISEFATFKLGMGKCGELASMAKLYFAKRNVHSIVVDLKNSSTLKKNHSFLLIGPCQNWENYFNKNKGENIDIFFERLPEMYIVDPLLRTIGPTKEFSKSATAEYLKKNKITDLYNEDSEIWDRDVVAYIEQAGKTVISELTPDTINEKLDDVCSKNLEWFLSLQFKDRKWTRQDQNPFSVRTHGKEEDLVALKQKLTELGLSEAEIWPVKGDGHSHCLVIRKLKFK